MTTWVNSQFPRPDFHRQVQRHYGLRNDSRPPFAEPISRVGKRRDKGSGVNKPSREGAPGGLDQSVGFPLPPLKFRTAGFPQYGFKWTVNGDLRRSPEA